MLETLLKELCETYGPSGRETPVREAIARLAAPHCQRLQTDPLGNLIAFRPGTSGKKLMFCAHMDQIGLMVTDIQPDGFLRCAAVGGLRPAFALARRVRFMDGLLGACLLYTSRCV